MILPAADRLTPGQRLWLAGIAAAAVLGLYTWILWLLWRLGLWALGRIGGASW